MKYAESYGAQGHRVESAAHLKELLAHCRERLSAYKVPAQVYLVPEIPRTGSGKIIRFRLKDTLKADNG